MVPFRVGEETAVMRWRLREVSVVVETFALASPVFEKVWWKVEDDVPGSHYTFGLQSRPGENRSNLTGSIDIEHTYVMKKKTLNHCAILYVR